ncbi:MAG: anthrone oxygenase family protein [Mycobacterium sp.]
MSTNPVLILTTTAALGAAAVGGLFYAFSTFTMRGLSRTDPHDAITAMRGINAEAQANAPFLVLFLGSSVLALAVGVLAVTQLDRPGSAYLLAGAALSVVALIVTIAFNVPLNNRLDAVHPDGLSAAEAARVWVAYCVPWKAWNHVRTAAPLVGAVLMLAGTRYR